MRTLLLVAAILYPLAALAQAPEDSIERMGVSLAPAKDGAGCSGGIQVDDGSFEDGYGFQTVVFVGEIGMRVDLPPGKKTLNAVCICWSRLGFDFDTTVSGGIDIRAADGPGGSPGTLLGAYEVDFPAVPLVASSFYRFEIPGGLLLTVPQIYVIAGWSPFFEDNQFFVCADESGPGGRPAWLRGTSTGAWSAIGTPNIFPGYRALGIRAEAAVVPDPPPPAGPWLATSQLPGFQFKVRINGAAIGTQVTDCVPETLCVAGAIPTRTELFLRIIGPRPNGWLWNQIVRFSGARLEVWVQRLSSLQTNYYDIDPVPQDSADLPGLVDKTAFLP